MRGLEQRVPRRETFVDRLLRYNVWMRFVQLTRGNTLAGEGTHAVNFHTTSNFCVTCCHYSWPSRSNVFWRPDENKCEG